MGRRRASERDGLPQLLMQLLVAGEAQARPDSRAAERVQPHAEPAADGLAHEGGRDAELDVRGRVDRHAVRRMRGLLANF